jgi:hypothetical protein
LVPHERAFDKGADAGALGGGADGRGTSKGEFGLVGGGCVAGNRGNVNVCDVNQRL